MKKVKKTPAIKAVSRSASILSGISDGINTTTAISEYCKVSKSTIHRLLKALVEAQLVTYDPINHKYFVGGLITGLLAKPLITHDYLINHAHEEMKRLLDAAGETVNLSILTGVKCISLHTLPSKNDLRVVEEVREIRSIHAGVAGKILLSQLDSKALKTALKNIELEPVTEYTVTSREELMFQLKRIRQQGYCICSNERIIGAMGIGAPVSNYVMPAALSIVGPEVRMKPRAKELQDALLTSAGRISRSIKK